MRNPAAVLKALSNGTRLSILGLVPREGELCVGDVVAVLGVTQSQASRHLRCLAKVGLLQDRGEALWVHYPIVEAPGPVPAAVLAARREIIPGAAPRARPRHRAAAPCPASWRLSGPRRDGATTGRPKAAERPARARRPPKRHRLTPRRPGASDPGVDRRSVAALGGALLLAGRLADAAPAHDICADLGPDLGVGIASYSAAGDWPEQAELTHGVDWRFLYLYVVPTSDPAADREWFWLHKAEVAASLGAVPVYTFYELLQRGQPAGLTGAEPEVVRAVLQDPDLMRAYFDDFVFLVETVAAAPTPPIVHVEPDSWGFMSWAMGIEGNADATTVPVAVAGSGHPELADLPDHAGGFGRALLRLRDRHAPVVRLAWHASNFRAGTRPEVTTGFYASLGEWDVIFTDSPHLEADEATWWEPADPAAVDANVAWLRAVSAGASLPIVMWQMPIGTTDWHLFDSEPTLLRRFVEAGLGAGLFDLRGEGEPDGCRAVEGDGLDAVPPADSEAGGTAADMRRRLAAYTTAPLAWPLGTLCAGRAPGAGGAPADGASGTGASSTAATSGGDGAPPAPGDGTATAAIDGGCGCRAARTGHAPGPATLVGLAALRLFARRRARVNTAAADRASRP